MKLAPGLLDDFRENFGIENTEIFAEMEPHPQWGLTEKNEYRKFYEVPAAESDDEGWKKFQSVILKASVFRDCGITYRNYLDWTKDGMKLGKWLSKTFTDAVLKKYGQTDINIKAGLFDMYFKDAMEKIGAFRVKGEVNTVMVSCNAEDKLMASMHPAFRSCMSLDSGYGYWRGLITTLANPNIAVVCLMDAKGKTEYELKNGYKVVVPRILARSFAFMMHNEKTGKYTAVAPRFYDKQFSSGETLTEVTGYNWLYSSERRLDDKWKTEIPSKFPIWHKPGHKTQLITTPYFDGRCRVVDYKPLENTYQIKSGGQVTSVRTIQLQGSLDFYKYNEENMEGKYA